MGTIAFLRLFWCPMTRPYTPPRKSVSTSQQSMYELDSDTSIGTEWRPESGRRNRRGSRGKRGTGGSGERAPAESRISANSAFRTALAEGSHEFLSDVCERLRSNDLPAGSVRILIELDAWKRSAELAALLQTYISTHPAESSGICGQMIHHGFFSFSESRSVERALTDLHHYTASANVIGTERHYIATGTGPNYKIARSLAFQRLLLQLCGADDSETVVIAPTPSLSRTFAREVGAGLPFAQIIDDDAPRDIGYQAAASFKLNGKEWERAPAELRISANSAFRTALAEGSDEFLSDVRERLRSNDLPAGSVRILIEMDAWKLSAELAALLQAYILAHPTESSGICGHMIQHGVLSLSESRSVERALTDLHHYTARANVIGTERHYIATGTGPSYQIARTFAFQRLLLQLCGTDDPEAVVVAPKPSLWRTFAREVGAGLPNAQIIDDDAPRHIGYQATASFKLNGREWNAVGEISPWKTMATHSALEVLYFTVTNDLNWAPETD